MHHENDLFYTEEDQADAYSNFIFKDVKTFSSCSKFTPTSEGNSYIIEPLGHDIHSPAIVRLIRQATQANRELSASCEEYKRRTKDVFSYEECL